MQENREEMLHKICKDGSLEELKNFMREDILVNWPEPRRGWTALHFICDRSDEASAIAMLDFIFNFGVELIARDCDGRTPLHIAAEKGFIRLREELVRRGADPHMKVQKPQL